MPKWIKFVERDVPDGMKTKRWFVFPNQPGELLGTITWFGRWRKYTFNPMPGTTFEEDCLRDIATFVEDETRKHRENLKEAYDHSSNTQGFSQS
jgi:hypothetical protein